MTLVMPKPEALNERDSKQACLLIRPTQITIIDSIMLYYLGYDCSLCKETIFLLNLYMSFEKMVSSALTC